MGSGTWTRRSRPSPRSCARGGYQTACFGTWHVNDRPYASGFDIFDPESECELVAANVEEFVVTRDASEPFFAMAGFFEPHRVFHRPLARPARPGQPAGALLPAGHPRDQGGNVELLRRRGPRRLGAGARYSEPWTGPGKPQTPWWSSPPITASPCRWPRARCPTAAATIGAVLSWPGLLPANSRYGGLTSNVDPAADLPGGGRGVGPDTGRDRRGQFPGFDPRRGGGPRPRLLRIHLARLLRTDALGPHPDPQG